MTGTGLDWQVITDGYGEIEEPKASGVPFTRYLSTDPYGVLRTHAEMSSRDFNLPGFSSEQITHTQFVGRNLGSCTTHPL